MKLDKERGGESNVMLHRKQKNSLNNR